MPVANPTMYVRVVVKRGAVCQFYVSSDNQNFKPFGNEFKANKGQWIGAKMGFFVTRPIVSNDGGWLDIDWFRVE